MRPPACSRPLAAFRRKHSKTRVLDGGPRAIRYVAPVYRMPVQRWAGELALVRRFAKVALQAELHQALEIAKALANSPFLRASRDRLTQSDLYVTPRVFPLLKKCPDWSHRD